MIKAIRSYNEIADDLMEQNFTPSILVFSDSRFGTIKVEVHGITIARAAQVEYVAQRPNQPAFRYDTLREAFKTLGIE